MPEQEKIAALIVAAMKAASEAGQSTVKFSAWGYSVVIEKQPVKVAGMVTKGSGV